MGLRASVRLAYLEKWARLHYANYLRYAHEHGLSWQDKMPFNVRTLVASYVEDQNLLYAKIVDAILDLDGVEPPQGYLEDVAYLNYVHLPVVFSRAVNRAAAIAPDIARDVATLVDAGEFELADLGEEIVVMMKSQAEGLRPYCQNEDQMSPA